MSELLLLEDSRKGEIQQSYRINTAAESEQVNLRVHLSRSFNTRKSYEGHWKTFISFCATQNLTPFPASLETITLFLQSRFDGGVKASSLESSLSSIRAVHSDNRRFLKDVDSIGIFDERLARVLKSFKRQYVEAGKSGTRKPHAFSQDEISRLISGIEGSSLADIQRRAMLLLGFNSGMRISEIIGLRVSDVTVNFIGADIFIMSSKTDQLGSGENIFIHKLAPSHQQYDAVLALEKWIQARKGLMENNPEMYEGVDNLFIPFRKNGFTPHLVEGKAHAFSREAFSRWFKAHSEACNIKTTAHVASHSLRHSFASQAFRRGVDIGAIAMTTRHKNLRVLMGYNQQSRIEQSISPKLWG